MTALLISGIALAGFGVLVLLKFPDRPGGTIRLHRMEVSSAGAGLPLIVLGIAAMVFSAVGIGTADGGPLSRPVVGKSPANGATTSPAVADNWVARNPGTIDLLACCVRFIGYEGWEQKPAVIVRQPYNTTLRWTSAYDQYGEDGVAIPLSADRQITRLTAVVGIANDADGVSSALEATVVVKIDGAEAKRETITVVNPLRLDQNVADVGRVELFFIAGGDVPVVIAELTGHQG